MIIFPAIDIKDGKVVRLRQGLFDKVTVYSQEPLTVAQQWEQEGAKWLHVVDLDGAQTGELKNTSIIFKIARTVKIPIQVGGGIRKKENIKQLLDGGVARVILGTKVIEDRQFFKEALTRWPKKIAVSLDCQKGFVAQRGWAETLPIKATTLAKELEQLGLNCLIYTDIARDGMLKGPNFEGLKEMLNATHIPLIASGGVSSLADIKELMALKKDGLIGAIIGKAIYESMINLKEVIQLCSPKE